MTWQTRLLATVSFIVMWATLFEQRNRTESTDVFSTYVKLLHLASFSAAFGSALWVTFFFGIVSFYTIPRHLFGNVRSKVFPANFCWVAIFSAVSVASFGYLHPLTTTSVAEICQLGLLLSAFTFNLSNLLIFTPMTIQMMKERHRVERALSIGQEIGISWKSMEVANVNPKLADVNSKFASRHAFAALALLMYFISLIMHSWYLAGKINI